MCCNGYYMANTAKVRAGTEKDEAGEFLFEVHSYVVPEDWKTVEALHAFIAAEHGEEKATKTVNACALRGYKIAKEGGFRGRVKAKEDALPDTDEACQDYMAVPYAVQSAQTGMERMAKQLAASGLAQEAIDELLTLAQEKGL